MLGIELTPEHPVERVVELGAAAETAGYDTVFVSHHYNNRDATAVATRLATETDGVRLGPGVANPFESHPVTLASEVATLDELTDGRAVFGLGPGDPSTLRNLGMADDRGLRPVLEAFETARDLWAGERVDGGGTFDADDAGLNYEPPQGASIPVYVGGEGPHMCRMAGKRADGLLFNGSHPADLSWARDRVAEGIGEADGKTADDFDLAAYASVSVGEDGDAAREAARPPVAFVAAGSPPPVLDRHGVDHGVAEEIGDLIAEGSFSEAFDAVTPGMIDAFCIAGTPETVADRIDAVLEHADSLVVGSPLGPDLDAAVELAAEAAPDEIREE
ncbi:5,10-methylenetetrahydromethanopterin reductase [Halobaculum sp. MBLA0143]|uniref:5,10-methylenetetrahydromethanopterin reductase n=1 Tax=Halobaculum sp. MBLA0143 TaxID=3079933 RepID=UPI0035241F75